VRGFSWHPNVVLRIEEIEIEGYRSIRQAKIELRGLNVLIGANGAGKSNLLGALGLLGDITNEQLQLSVARRGGAHALLHFGRKRTPQLKLRVALRYAETKEPVEYRTTLEATSDDAFIFADEDLLEDGILTRAHKGYRESILSVNLPGRDALQLPNRICSWRVFHFNDTGPSSSIKAKHSVDDNRELRPDGKNLAALLYGLKQRAPLSYSAILESVQAVAPFFKDFALRPDAVNPKVIQLEWQHRTEPDDYFNADSLSDGTLRFLCLSTLLLQPDRPSLILLDEPELGLHPAAIVHLAELLRSVSKTTQVLVTTQSVTLLEQFAPEDVLVAERQGEETVFHRLDEASLAGWLVDYTLGQLWLKNVLGGRP
jgi:predicted ATPase